MALTPQELVWLRKRVRQLIGLRATRPPSAGIKYERRRELEKVAQSFVKPRGEE